MPKIKFVALDANSSLADIAKALGVDLGIDESPVPLSTPIDEDALRKAAGLPEEEIWNPLTGKGTKYLSIGENFQYDKNMIQFSINRYEERIASGDKPCSAIAALYDSIKSMFKDIDNHKSSVFIITSVISLIDAHSQDLDIEAYDALQGCGIEIE